MLRSLAGEQVQSDFDRVDYVAVVDSDTLLTAAESPARLLIAVAAHLGTTRLIDNVVLGEDPRP
jgi:pantoate--beta-alanine ligase